MKIIRLLGLAALLAASVQNIDAREVLTLSDGWGVKPQRLHEKKVPYQDVTIPHTWNTEYIPGTHIYAREMMIYRRNLAKTPQMNGKRVFLYFEGVNSAADVFINHNIACSHLGGYTAFSCEITKLLKDGDNELEVWCSNAYRTDVLPLAGDFNVFGGIHRPVRLIITGDECISPLFYASPGVLVHQKGVSAERADIVIETKVLSDDIHTLRVRSTVLDSEGREVAKFTTAAASSTEIPFKIRNPHLWKAVEDPYLYSVRSELLRDGNVIDAVEVKTGFRFIDVDAEKGFYLNGKSYDLHGFCRHEDFGGRGSALLPENYERDMELIRECGATTLRLAHYPHGEMIYDLSDRNGIVLMTEIPMCGPGGYQYTGAIATEGFMKNARQCAFELVYQKMNHPSICFWGIFNEILDFNGKGRFGYDDPQAIASEINEIYHSLDRSRPTTLANAVDLPLFLGCADIIGINKYYAWYDDINGPTVGDYFREQKKLAEGKAVGVTEYGGGASINQHESPVKSDFNPTGRWHPEENQNLCHELNWKSLKECNFMWGKYIWIFHDFQSQIRTEGEFDGMNDKGLVTYDRKTKKDAFYFYKAQWNPEPMVYITSRRYVERNDPKTEIKVYTNLPKVDLYLNGEKVASGKPDEIGRFSVPVVLKEGLNTIKVCGKGGVEDSCEWTLKTK